ncbi:pilus assembly protein TadG-related protein [Nocardioides sp. Kera G14]|uniref:pilus assembly protein TadG-related protein n=1 Tax=Nocardioides sp. Kera G14 TaxID=2884264 RepID=UPI001D0FA21F|nr:pilus assembly protein TadG-related protein [Nocardioides sp. Kera G14]UDY23768.1 pilus assembly protein TadG-related protein [Nocardioides sp. Kera G14]
MSLLSITIVMVVAFAVFGIFLMGRGVNDKTEAQTAADAAALAGAQDLVGNVKTLLQGLTDKTDLGGIGNCNDGKARASDYAEKNGASLTDYCFDSASGEVSVSVTLDHDVSADLGPAKASATATTGLDLNDCHWDSSDTPTPPPTEAPTATATGTPTASATPTETPSPDPVPTSLTCGELVVNYLWKWDGTAWNLTLDGDVDTDDLKPHLVG